MCTNKINHRKLTVTKGHGANFEQNMTLTLKVKGQFHGEYTLKSACIENIGDLDTYTHILRH